MDILETKYADVAGAGMDKLGSYLTNVVAAVILFPFWLIGLMVKKRPLIK